MVNPNRFYTYAYLRDDKTPYYIGKGSGRRINDNKRRLCKKPKDKSRIIFLKQNLTEEEAFKHEKYMIAVFGRKNLGTGILHNRTNGGDGASGFTHSEETIQKFIEANTGENNPFYGKSHTEETKIKQSKNMKGENNPNFGKSPSRETRRKKSEVMKGRKRWNDGCGNSTLSFECPGEGWVLGVNEETRKKQSEKTIIRNLGRKWWNDGCGNTKFCVECPGESWFPGRGEEIGKKQSVILKGENNSTRGTKWWNDGRGNTIRSVECPGEGWILGMSEETKRKQSKVMKGKTIGKKWWNDGYGNTARSPECPGKGWVPGRGKR